jgi:hypothetical protein
MFLDERQRKVIETLKDLPFIEDAWIRDLECSHDGPNDFCVLHDIYSPVEQKVRDHLDERQIQMIVNFLRDNEVPISFRLKKERNRLPSGFFMVYTVDGREIKNERLLYHAERSGELPRLDLY